MVKLYKLYIFADGASPGNPGNAGIAFIIEDAKGKILAKHSEPIGFATNIVAEYTAIIKALEKATEYSNGEVFVFSDSETPIRQINSNYRVKEKHLKPLYEKVKDLVKNFQNVTFENLPREDYKIRRVDKLARQATRRNL